MDNRHSIGSKIQKYRKLKDMTQDELSKQSGIYLSTIKKYESGERNPKPDQLQKIAEALGISVTVFLDYDINTVSDVLSLVMKLNEQSPLKINDVIQNLDPKIFKSKNQFIIDAIQFYIDNYGKETFVIKKKEKERAEYIRSEDIDDIKDEVIEAATNEARKEVIRLLGGVISGMNVGQPVIMQAANSEAQEPTEDVMDDADVAGLAMGWMSKGD